MLGQRRQDAVETGHPLRRCARRVTEPLDEGGLPSSFHLAFDRERRSDDLGLRRGDRDVQSGRQALAQIGVQEVLDGGVDLVGRTDGQVPEPVLLELVEHGVGRMPEVLQSQLVHMMLLALA